MFRFMSIDPGDAHCGFAKFIQCEGGQWLCTETGTMGPEEFLDMVTDELDIGLDMLVIEEFRLYPTHARVQHYSTFPTVEVIGALRYLARRHGRRVVMQPAAAKKPALGIAKAKGHPLHTEYVRGTGHAKDAELHGLYFIYECEAGRQKL